MNSSLVTCFYVCNASNLNCSNFPGWHDWLQFSTWLTSRNALKRNAEANRMKGNGKYTVCQVCGYFLRWHQCWISVDVSIFLFQLGSAGVWWMCGPTSVLHRHVSEVGCEQMEMGDGSLSSTWGFREMLGKAPWKRSWWFQAHLRLFSFIWVAFFWACIADFWKAAIIRNLAK